MSLSQFITDWNGLFDFKISVGDVKKSSPSFVFEIFQFFLSSIHIDCAKLKLNKDDRRYKILLVKYLNQFFKDCKYTCNFLYADFIQPDPKKIVGILRFMHNYYEFFKAVKVDIVNSANEKIEKYNQLLSQKKQLQLLQEEFKIQSEKKEIALEEYTRQIAEYKQLLADLKKENISLAEAEEKASQQLHSTEDENIELAEEIKVLAIQIVTEEELGLLMEELKDYDDKIVQLDSEEERILSKNECHTKVVNQLIAEIEEFSTTNNESSVIELMEKYRDELKNFNEMNAKIKEFRSKIENKTANRVELVESVKSLEAQLLEKRNDLNSMSEKNQIKTMEKESEYKRGLIHSSNCEKKLETAEQQVEELKITQEQIITMGINVIDQIENS